MYKAVHVCLPKARDRFQRKCPGLQKHLKIPQRAAQLIWKACWTVWHLYQHPPHVLQRSGVTGVHQGHTYLPSLSFRSRLGMCVIFRRRLARSAAGARRLDFTRRSRIREGRWRWGTHAHVLPRNHR